MVPNYYEAALIVYRIPKSHRLTFSELPIVQLAHSSVLEYLTGHKKDFSISAQNSEAALLCFSRISASKEHLELSSKAESSLSDAASTKNFSSFLKYCCEAWPFHCRRAFNEDSSCSLLEEAKNFILSDGYMSWNTIMRCNEFNPGAVMRELLLKVGTNLGISIKPLGVPYLEARNVSCNEFSARPGFVIAKHDLTKLLEFHEIRDLIDFQHINCEGMILLF